MHVPMRVANMKKTNDTIVHIVTAMAKVQESQSNPFKLNEIVTLEKCLQELSTQDPLINSIIRCLANECSIVEPPEKQQHLSRSKQEIQEDNEFKRRASEMNDKIALVNYENAFYKTKLDELIKGEKELRVEIFRQNKSIAAVDNIYKLLFNEFNLLVERVYSSFGYSLPIVDSLIPQLVRSIPDSKLAQQTDSLARNYRRFLLKLVKSSQRAPDKQLSDNFRISAMDHLLDYTKVIVNLYRDLASICQLYSNEVPSELEYLSIIEGHMEFLERPPHELTPKWITHKYQNLYELDINVNGSEIAETVTILVNPELSRLLSSIKRLYNCVK